MLDEDDFQGYTIYDRDGGVADLRHDEWRNIEFNQDTVQFIKRDGDCLITYSRHFINRVDTFGDSPEDKEFQVTIDELAESVKDVE
jgi:hypothetical protein